MNLKTRYSFILTVMVVVIIMAVAVLLLSLLDNTLKKGINTSDRLMRQHIDYQLEQRGLSISKVLAINLINPVYRFDTDEMYQQLQAVMHLPDIIYCIIYDEQGRIIHDGHNEIKSFGNQLDDAFIDKALNSNNAIVQRQGNLLNISHPLFIGTERIGGVRIGIELDKSNILVDSMRGELKRVLHENILDNLITSGSIAFSISLLLGFFVATRISRSISIPIKQIADYARDVSEGKTSTIAQLPILRHDELGSLTRALS